MHIGSVKFATQLKESPCSPVVTFPRFGSEGHGVDPPVAGLVFCFLFFVFFFFLFFGERYFCFVLKRLNNGLNWAIMDLIT